MESTSTYELPSYSSLAPVPTYSCELGSGERSLQQTPRSRSSRPTPSSLFIKKAGRTTITLEGQETDARIPVYGRHANITGSIILEHSDTVLDVVAKLEGRLEVTTSTGGSESLKLLNDTYTLWTRTAAEGACPTQLSFSFLLPSEFKHKGEQIPLPPSYNMSEYSLPSIHVRVRYEMKIIVSRLRHQKVGTVWPKTKNIIIPISYVPKTRPHRPIVYSDCFFSSIKSTPEEWFQAVSCFKMRLGNSAVTVAPISASLFVPSTRIYGLSDKIPFHVQLSGDVNTLRDLFSNETLGRVMSVDSHNTVESRPKTRSPPTQPILRVTLLRQTAVSLRNSNSWKNTILAEGTITPVPPDPMSWYAAPGETCDAHHLDWEGDLCLEDDKITCGFMTAHVEVKDFICLTVTPPKTSPLQLLRITIPIRLVTDSYTEALGIDTTTQS